MRARSLAAVSPVRTSVRMATSANPLRASSLPYAFERRFEIAVDVVAERLERRDVDDLHSVRERPVETLADQVVDRGEEGGERLAGAGRRGDQRVPSGLDRGPGVRLGRARRPKGARKPCRHGGMEEVGASMTRARMASPGRLRRLARQLGAPVVNLGRGSQSAQPLVRVAARFRSNSIDGDGLYGVPCSKCEGARTSADGADGRAGAGASTA